MTLVKISIIVSVVALLVMVFGLFLDKYCSPRRRYFIWLVLALRLLIPFDINLPGAPISINPKPHTVVLRAEHSLPVSVVPENTADGVKDTVMLNPNSADYAPIADLGAVLRIVWAVGAAAAFWVPFGQYLLFRFHLPKEAAEYQKSTVPVYFADTDTPMLTGFFQPIILLPRREYTAEELELIVLHEETHRRRGDLWYKLMLMTARAIHWFNPIIWVMVRRAARDLEYSCDFTVCRGKDIEFRKKYSKAILSTLKKEERS